MNDSPDPVVGIVRVPALDRQRKREELRTWLFLSFVMAPVLSVLVVAGYGFLIWMYQLLVGPPAS